MEKFIAFCTSIYMIYILSFGWAVHAFWLIAQNKKLLKRCDSLQNENVKIKKLNEDAFVTIQTLESQIDDLTEEE